MALTLNKNDVAILLKLADFRLMTVRQIVAPERGNERSVRARLKALANSGYVELLPSPQTRRRGHPESVYGITESALGFLKSRGDLSRNLRHEQVGCQPLQNQIAHQLLLNWFRVHIQYLTIQATDSSSRFLSCNSPFALDPESGYPLIRQRITESAADAEFRQQWFIPDAVFSIGSASLDKELLFFLEVDMGTESLTSSSERGKDLQEKILRYQKFFDQEAYKRYETTWQVAINGFRLLFLAVSEKRMHEICSAVRATPSVNFVWITCQEYLFAHGVSGDIWVCGGITEAGLKSILGRHASDMPLGDPS